MICGACGKDAPTMVHQFFEGTPETPARRWVIIAPLYFKATADGLGCEVPFCGVGCAGAYERRER